MIQDNLRRVKERIALAAERSGRKSSDITLVAVSKFHALPVINEAIRAGQTDFGENYVQELSAKSSALHACKIRWHMIGHLQRNKINKTLPVAALIHSVDSISLLNALNTAGQKRSAVIPILLEVNVSRETGKSGFAPETVPHLGECLQNLPNVRVDGLMTLAAYSDDQSQSQAAFAELRELRERLRAEWGAQFPLPHLSMGMSNDFEAAIREGATIVRIGAAIFGSRRPGI
jgi:pyridoxal phosphate enzyme (YggS family)